MVTTRALLIPRTNQRRVLQRLSPPRTRKTTMEVTRLRRPTRLQPRPKRLLLHQRLLPKRVERSLARPRLMTRKPMAMTKR